MIDPVPAEVVETREPPRLEFAPCIVQFFERDWQAALVFRDEVEAADWIEGNPGTNRILRVPSKSEVELTRLREAMHEAAIDVLECRTDCARLTYWAARDAYSRATKKETQ